MEEFDWSAESQVQIPAEHIWCDLNAHLEPKMNHQTPLTYGYSHFIHFKTATEVEIEKLRTRILFPSLLPQFGSAIFSS